MFPATTETDSVALQRLALDSITVFELYELFAAGTETTAGVFEYVPQEPIDTPKAAHDWLVAAADYSVTSEQYRAAVDGG